MPTRSIACELMRFKICTTWIFFLCMTTSFRPLQKAPSLPSVPFRPCTYGSCLWISQVWLHTLHCSKDTGYCWDQREIMCNITDFFLHERHLAQNPFICDCHLKWLADYLHTNPIETSGARCTSPRRLANKRIGQIKSKKFRCSGNFLSSAAVLPLLPTKKKKKVVIEVLMKAALSLQNY